MHTSTESNKEQRKKVQQFTTFPLKSQERPYRPDPDFYHLNVLSLPLISANGMFQSTPLILWRSAMISYITVS
jgi:hypothetical protein